MKKRPTQSLPSGTFTEDMNPTITLRFIAIMVAREISKESDPKKINTAAFRKKVVDFLDGLGLLPTKFTTSQKAVKIGQFVSWMVTEQSSIQPGQIHSYAACSKALREAKRALKLAAKS